MEASNGNADVCRLCMEDLSQDFECFLIDEELGNLVSTLTGISVDLNDETRPLMMCTICLTVLNRFNRNRSTWIENQTKFSDRVCKDEDIEELSHELSEEDLGALEDSSEEFAYPIEYIEELEFGENEEVVSGPGVCALEVSQEEVSEINDTSTKSMPKSKKLAGSAYKGKEVYQKLLQKCPECSKRIEKNRLEGHLNKHRNIRPYVCEQPDCGKTFFCKLLLRLHRTSIHTNQIIECKICSKTFKSERSLYTHNLRHKNEDRYACTYCDKKFNNNNSLCRHLAIHSGVREFSCNQCEASFYRKFNLDTHIRNVHAKVKSYTCEFCPKKFGYARLLREHSRVHSENVTQSIYAEAEVDES